MKLINLGPIKQAEITLANLMVLNGDNNTGKTYLSYVLYSLIKVISQSNFSLLSTEEFDIFIRERKIEVQRSTILDRAYLQLVKLLKLKKIQNRFFNYLDPDFTLEIDKSDFLFLSHQESYQAVQMSFGSDELQVKAISDIKKNIVTCEYSFNLKINLNDVSTFSKDSIKTSINTAIKDSVFGNINAVYFPAERTGINLLYEPLVHDRFKQGFNIRSYVNDVNNLSIDLPLPIYDYMMYLNEIKRKLRIKSLKSNIPDHISNMINDKLVEGSYKYNEEANSIMFNNKDSSVFLENSSSSAKSLYGFEHLFSVSFVNNIVFIDEPELHLHPSKQILIMNIIAELVKSKYKIILTTHSDYIIRELYILLQNKQLTNDRFNSNKVVMYFFPNGKIPKKQKMDDIRYLLENFESVNNQQDRRILDIFSEISND